jgi:hypothetical protein
MTAVPIVATRPWRDGKDVMRHSSLPIAPNLAAALERTGVSQSDLARRMTARGFRTHASTVNRYVSGAVTPSVDLLAGIAECLRVSVDELLGLRPAAAPPAPAPPPIDDDVRAIGVVAGLTEAELERLASMQRAVGSVSRTRLLSYASDIVEARPVDGGSKRHKSSTRIRSVGH